MKYEFAIPKYYRLGKYKNERLLENIIIFQFSNTLKYSKRF